MPNNEKTGRLDFVNFIVRDTYYAIDVSCVKEISKIGKITPLPNAYEFILGAYNLRGEVIPILDMRKMLGLGSSTRIDSLYQVIILHLNEHLIGITVDKILSVITYNSAEIEEAHEYVTSLGQDFMKGIFYYNKNLFWYIDAQKLLGKGSGIEYYKNVLESKKKDLERTAQEISQNVSEDAGVSTLSENKQAGDFEEKLLLKSLYVEVQKLFFESKNYFVNEMQQDWIMAELGKLSRLQDELRKLEEGDLTLVNKLLEQYASKDADTFWSDETVKELAEVLQQIPAKNLRVLDIGCGQGYSSYSLATLVKHSHPDNQLAFYACDKNLEAITLAVKLHCDAQNAPEYMKKSLNGSQFKEEIVHCIHFEYHDILEENFYEDIDIVLIRDLFIEFNSEQKRNVLNLINKITHTGAILIIGDNEKLINDEGTWKENTISTMSVYDKIK